MMLFDLLNLLNSNLDPTPAHKHAGVYKISIILEYSLRMFYLGTTKRNFLNTSKNIKELFCNVTQLQPLLDFI